MSGMFVFICFCLEIFQASLSWFCIWNWNSQCLDAFYWPPASLYGDEKFIFDIETSSSSSSPPPPPLSKFAIQIPSEPPTANWGVSQLFPMDYFASVNLFHRKRAKLLTNSLFRSLTARVFAVTNCESLYGLCERKISRAPEFICHKSIFDSTVDVGGNRTWFWHVSVCHSGGISPEKILSISSPTRPCHPARYECDWKAS